MKTRQAFVANSSSSSFVILYIGDETPFDDPDRVEHWLSEADDTDEWTLTIDDLMAELVKAKEKGIKEVTFKYGTYYC